MIFRNKKGDAVVLVANKKELPVGTFHKILKDVGISLQEFEGLL